MEETENDLEAAKKWLKKKGFREAENKMSRTADTKLVGLKVYDSKVSVSVLRCETDFVAGTDMFRNFSNILLDILSHSENQNISEDDMANLKIGDNSYDTSLKNMTVMEGLKNLISKTQENCKISQYFKFSYDPKSDIIGTYLHGSPEGSPNLGQKAAFVALTHDSATTFENRQELSEFANLLAMQVVALNPTYLSKEDIPAEILENEKNILAESVKDEKNKEKIINSKLNNWIAENVLNEQIFVIVGHESKDEKLKVQNLVHRKGQEHDLKNLRLKDFKLFK